MEYDSDKGDMGALNERLIVLRVLEAITSLLKEKSKYDSQSLRG